MNRKGGLLLDNKTQGKVMAMKTSRTRIGCWWGMAVLLGIFALGEIGCGRSGSSATVVNSSADMETVPSGTVTLRSAWAAALKSGEPITFDSSLNGKTISLSIIGEAHSTLKGETYTGMTFEGYADRDYGKSALYANGDITIDASALTDGITIAWTGGDTSPARVLAVYGNLTLKNVTITGGYSLAEALPNNTAQPYTIIEAEESPSGEPQLWRIAPSPGTRLRATPWPLATGAPWGAAFTPMD